MAKYDAAAVADDDNNAGWVNYYNVCYLVKFNVYFY